MKFIWGTKTLGIPPLACWGQESHAAVFIVWKESAHLFYMLKFLREAFVEFGHICFIYLTLPYLKGSASLGGDRMFKDHVILSKQIRSSTKHNWGPEFKQKGLPMHCKECKANNSSQFASENRASQGTYYKGKHANKHGFKQKTTHDKRRNVLLPKPVHLAYSPKCNPIISIVTAGNKWE